MEVLLPTLTKPRQSVPSLSKLCLRELVRHPGACASLSRISSSPTIVQSLYEAFQQRFALDHEVLLKFFEAPVTEWAVREPLFADEALFRQATRAWASTIVSLELWLVDVPLEALVAATTAFKSLRRLTVALTPISSVTQLLEPCVERLECLSLASLEASVGDALLLLLAEKAVKLHSFRLENCNEPTSSGLRAFCSARGAQLTEFTAHQCDGLDDSVLKALTASGNTQLCRLELGNGNVSDKGVAPLLEACAMTLKELDLNLTGISCSSLERLARANNALPLRRADLGKLYNVTSEAVAALLGSAEELEELNLRNHDEADDLLMETVTLCCPKLRRLTLRGCEAVTDVGVGTILAESEHLEYLDIRKGPKISLRLRQVIFATSLQVLI